MDHLTAGKTLMGFITLVVLGAGAALTPDYGIARDTSAAQRAELVSEYREQLSFVRQEIQTIRQDLEWLSMRIQRMKTMNRYIPEKMQDSVAFKKEKIKSLSRLEDKYKELLTRKGGTTGFAMPTGDAADTKLAQEILKSGLGDWLEVIPMDPHCRIENRLPILFSSASARVAKQYHSFLGKLARLLKGYNVKVVIDGFADTDPIRTDKYPSNFELGAARAANVARILIKSGLRPSVIKIGSTGRYRPRQEKVSERKAFERNVRISVIFLS